MSWSQEKIQETVKQLQEKAETDSSFREQLKTNPNTAIEEIAGIQVPVGFKVNIVDANDADLTIALPKTKSDELSDSDLEAVAGGKWTDGLVTDETVDVLGKCADQFVDDATSVADDVSGAFTNTQDKV